MKDLFYTRNGVDYFVGDKVMGEFADWDSSTFGIVRFGLHDAYWPTVAHEWAEAYGFYVETQLYKSGYSIVQIKDLSKIHK